MIRLDRAKTWLPKIKDIGFVTGTYNITVADAATQTYPVRKRGVKTHLTSGVVISLGTVSTPGYTPTRSSYDMVIRPDAGTPANAQAAFADHGDSGSAVVNAQNQIVGLVWGSEDAGHRHASATPIKIVLDRFAEIDKLDLEVAVAGPNPTDVSELKTVAPAAALRCARRSTSSPAAITASGGR